MAENGLGSWCGIDAQELGADGDATIETDLDVGMLAPNEGSPGAVGFGAQEGALFFERQVPGFLGNHLQFPMNLALVAVQPESLDVGVGVVEIDHVLAGKVGGQTLLPEEVSTLDLAFGLRGRSEPKGNAIEVEGLTKLGEGLGVMGEKQAVVIDVEFQRQPVLREGSRQEIEVSEQGFAFVDFGGGEDSAAIVEHVDHGEGLSAAGKPAVGRSIQLPQLVNLTALPAPNGCRGPVIRFGVSQVVFHSPATDLGSIELKLTLAEHLAGSKAIGSRRFTT